MQVVSPFADMKTFKSALSLIFMLSLTALNSIQTSGERNTLSHCIEKHFSVVMKVLVTN